MTDIVVNRCPKGSILSDAGLAEYKARSGDAAATVETIPRDSAILVAMMRENPGEWGGICAHIKIVTVEDGFAWKVVKRGNSEYVAADA